MGKQPRPHPGYNKSRTARMDHCDVLRRTPPMRGIAAHDNPLHLGYRQIIATLTPTSGVYIFKARKA